MTNYYFFATLLPELVLGTPPEIPLESFMDDLNQNLTKEDLKKVQDLRRLYDLENIRSFWMGLPLSPLGNYDSVALEEALLTQKFELPDYMVRFMDQYESTKDRLAHFSSLWASYFREEIAKAPEGFLRNWLEFERKMRLVLTALRAKSIGKNTVSELEYEDPLDPFIAPILAQKDAKEYDPPDQFQGLKGIYLKLQNDPLELKKRLSEFRFNKAEELIGLDRFSADRILAYLVQLIMVEKGVA